MEGASYRDFVTFAVTVLQRVVNLCAAENADFAAVDATMSQLKMVKRNCLNIARNSEDAEQSSLSAILQEIEIQTANLSLLLGEKDCETHANISVSKTATGGRPKYDLPPEDLLKLKQEGFTDGDISAVLHVGVRTVRDRLKMNGIRKKDLKTPISDGDLDRMVKTVSASYATIGYRQMWAHLQSQGVIVERQRIQESMQRTDPLKLASRTVRLIPRRKYRVNRPNGLWHLDGNLKLVHYGFVIHGCIDGYSHMVVYLKCNSNNKARTVLKAFLTAVEEYDVPSRVRADHGGENVSVGEWMVTHCGDARGSFITGKSVHNQRIERFWLDLRIAVIDWFLALFRQMEEDGLLDIGNTVHLLVLRHVFLSRIQAKIDEYRSTWNHHKLRTASSKSPLYLWRKGSLTVGLDGFKQPSNLAAERALLEQQENSGSESEDRRGLPVLSHAAELEYLKQNLPVNVDDGYEGRALFMRGLELLRAF